MRWIAMVCVLGVAAGCGAEMMSRTRTRSPRGEGAAVLAIGAAQIAAGMLLIYATGESIDEAPMSGIGRESTAVELAAVGLALVLGVNGTCDSAVGLTQLAGGNYLLESPGP